MQKISLTFAKNILFFIHSIQLSTVQTYQKKTSINCNGQLISLKDPIVMAIVNITPDSFYDGGKYTENDLIVKRVAQIIHEGADIVDIGAYSSRPGATHITDKEESSRIFSALEVIRKKFPNIVISIDTFRSTIAKKAVEEFQVGMINDISAGNMDEKMFETVANLQVPYVMMHMKGTPQNMQQNPVYENIIKEIFAYFTNKISQLKLLGANDIIIDPGFGFSKSLEHNYQLLSMLEKFQLFDLPLLVGVSRKSMIYKLLKTSPKEALNGTAALHTIALQKGANILRVHDVKEAREIIQINKMLQ